MYSTLIIGTGISGLSLAYLLAKKGQRVCLITKEESAKKSNTFYAQGGIVFKGEKDSPSLLLKDILKAGGELVNKSIAKKISKIGPHLVEEFLIKEIGVRFNKENGKFCFTKEGAHSVQRILFRKDYTGREIEERLLNRVKENKNIDIRTNLMAIELIVNTYHSKDPQERYKAKEVFGVYAFNIKEKKVEKIFAHNTVIATGGIGYLYKHTTNPDCATGDGIAMALRAGAGVLNAEFIQFHPTTLYLPHSNERFLISESVRGEGGIIVNKKGEDIIKKQHPLGSLAPRDIVSRSIFDYLTKTKEPCVYLDLSEVKKRYSIKDRFPQIYEKCLERGIDIEHQPVPIIPAAHYFCGGIKTNLNGETEIKRLYAIGECACTGLHGANRLASTSLLEGCTMAYLCSLKLNNSVQKISPKRLKSISDWYQPDGSSADPLLIEGDIENLRNLMWNYAGIIRSRKRLKRLTKDLSYLFNTTEEFYRENRLSKRLIELRNMITVSREIAIQSFRNKKSIGCHYITE